LAKKERKKATKGQESQIFSENPAFLPLKRFLSPFLSQAKEREQTIIFQWAEIDSAPTRNDKGTVSNRSLHVFYQIIFFN
jgi:hypothetical protein